MIGKTKGITNFSSKGCRVSFDHVANRSAMWDSNEGVFFSRQLEHIIKEVFRTERPDLPFANGKLIPISFEAGAGAKTITYRIWDRVGIAKIITNFAKDLPRVDVNAREFTQKVKPFGDAFGYDVFELEEASMAGVALTSERGDTAMEANMQLINRLALNGDEEYDLKGFLDNPNIIEHTIPDDGTATDPRNWSGKTADQILRDLNSSPTAIVNTTNNVEKPDTKLIPIDQWNLITTKRIPDTQLTIAQFFLNSSPHIKSIEPLVELSGFGSGGTDVMVDYKRDPRKLKLHLPMPIRELPPEARGIEFIVNLVGKFGGVTIFKPLSIAITEGI